MLVKNVETVNLAQLLALLLEMGSSVAQAGLKLTMYPRMTVLCLPLHAMPWLWSRPLSPAIFCLFRDRILTYIPCWPQSVGIMGMHGVLCFKMHLPPPGSPE